MLTAILSVPLQVEKDAASLKLKRQQYAQSAALCPPSDSHEGGDAAAAELDAEAAAIIAAAAR